ncbi:hypothetical protein B0T17DRAFT_619801 [Bombardia bombarda]|uniref:BZIP transcription factor n=1 Tax=Bombardia bombarda TaxID=252184 RepID=A0AA40BV83_9PEZI|nr:hypothetical protein B0T17DRAFT_619801 [Bombardia bombarda]
MTTRSPSAEPPKSSTKRKGTRSVSTLTPSQLARKRANDREAQRAIRARTKEHIERLEHELTELKSRQSRDETVRELMRRNKALERELMAMRETLGLQGRGPPASSYPAPSPIGMRRLNTTLNTSNMCSSSSSGREPFQVLTCVSDSLGGGGGGGYDVNDNIAHGLPQPATSNVSSRASSFGQHSAEYSAAPSFGSSYLSTPEPCDAWSSVVPVSSVSVPSVVSSPCSSTGHPDDNYVPGGYIPTSVPSSMIDGSSGSSNGMIPGDRLQAMRSCLDGTGKVVKYEDLDSTGKIIPPKTTSAPATSSTPPPAGGGGSSGSNSSNNHGGLADVCADWMVPQQSTGADSRGGYGCHTSGIPQQHSSSSYLQQQSWNMYPTSGYYPQSPTL